MQAKLPIQSHKLTDKGADCKAARLAVFGFSSKNDNIQTGLDFRDSMDDLTASDIPDHIEKIFKKRFF